MPSIDAETKLAILNTIDDRVGRYAKVLAGIVMGVAAFTAVGLWQFLELTQAKAVITAGEVARGEAREVARTVSVGEVVVSLAQDEAFRSSVIEGIQPTPPGLVVAYHPANPNGPWCPEGWSPFSEADGNFILGTNRVSGQAPGDTGGSPTTVQLTAAHMPSHGHEVRDDGHTHIARAGKMADSKKESQGWPYDEAHHRFRSTNHGAPTGPNIGDAPIDTAALENSDTGVTIKPTSAGGKQISTMPPYIALVFCRKD